MSCLDSDGHLPYAYVQPLPSHEGQGALTNQFHKPTDEKRMIVILPEETYQDWLEVPLNRVIGFLVRYSADALVAMAPPII